MWTPALSHTPTTACFLSLSVSVSLLPDAVRVSDTFIVAAVTSQKHRANRGIAFVLRHQLNERTYFSNLFYGFAVMLELRCAD